MYLLSESVLTSEDNFFEFTKNTGEQDTFGRPLSTDENKDFTTYYLLQGK